MKGNVVPAHVMTVYRESRGTAPLIPYAQAALPPAKYLGTHWIRGWARSGDGDGTLPCHFQLISTTNPTIRCYVACIRYVG